MHFNQIKNIIFDLGDVVINIDFALTFKAFEQISPLSLEEVYEQFKIEKIWEKYETGELSNSQFIDLLKSSLQLKSSKEEIITAWNALLLDIPLKRIELLKELRKKYRLFFLSNTSEYHIIDVNRILSEMSEFTDLKQLVDVAYYSYNMGLRKPDPKIYEMVLEEQNILATETVFLDDNKDNIDSAKEIGLNTIWVEKHTDICDYLKDA